jgi:hypothetical protein
VKLKFSAGVENIKKRKENTHIEVNFAYKERHCAQGDQIGQFFTN